MKLEQLRYFLSLAKHQHLGRAAAEVAISPSAISHSIQNLEGEFGCRLFAKHGRNLQLTEDGKRFVELAHSLLDQANQVKLAMGEAQHDYAGHYRLTATHVYCEQLLTPAWMDLASKHPKLTAMISSQSSHEVVEKVIAGEMDFGLCLCPHDKPEIFRKVLRHDKLVICLRRGHPLVDAANFSFSDLQDYPAVVSKATANISNCELHPIFESLGVDLKTTLYCDSYHTIASALKGSNAWALLPSSIASYYTQSLTTIELSHPSTSIELVAIWPRKKKICKVSQVLSERLERLASIL